MSVPQSSLKGITREKPGGTSPSPVEGVEGIPGPSTLDPINCSLPQDGESEDYGDEADEAEAESTEEDSEVRKQKIIQSLIILIIFTFNLCKFNLNIILPFLMFYQFSKKLK